MTDETAVPTEQSPLEQSPPLQTSPVQTPLRLIFAGSPGAAVPSLIALAATAHDIVAVLTREDSEQGRKRILTATPVSDVAQAHGIPVIKSNRLAGAATDAITALDADLGVIVAYGGLLREPLLSAPRLGWINLHFSLLPRWRGAAPVQRSLIAGDDLTGGTVFQLVAELDAGEIYGQFTQTVNPNDTTGDLLASLAGAGAQLLTRVVAALADGTARGETQKGDVTLAPKLSLADGKIVWTADAATVHNQIRGVTPEPGAFTTVDGARIKVLAARIALPDQARAERPALPLAPGHLRFESPRVLIGTATDPLELMTVQPAAKKPMPAADWWRGRNASADAAVVAE